MKPSPLAYVTLAITLLFALSPAIAPDFTGFTDDQLPIAQPNPAIQPVGWAFSIWGLIYLWLIAGAIRGAFLTKAPDDWARMRPPLIASLTLGIFWLHIAPVSAIWATIIIVMMLALALLAFFRAGQSDPFWQRGPVAFYAGWLTAATAVSFGVLSAGYGILSESAAPFVFLALAVFAAALVLRARPTAWPYALSAGWALFGICAKSAMNANWSVLAMAGAGLVIVLALMLRGLVKGRAPI